MCWVVKGHYNIHVVDQEGRYIGSMTNCREFGHRIIAVKRTLDEAIKAMEEYFDPALDLKLYSSDEIVKHPYGKRRVAYSMDGVRVLVTLAIQPRNKIPKGWVV